MYIRGAEEKKWFLLLKWRFFLLLNETENKTLAREGRRKKNRTEINVRVIYKIRTGVRRKRRVKENDLLHCKNILRL